MGDVPRPRFKIERNVVMACGIVLPYNRFTLEGGKIYDNYNKTVHIKNIRREEEFKYGDDELQLININWVNRHVNLLNVENENYLDEISDFVMG